MQSFYYLDDDCGDNLSNCEDDMSYIGANNSSDFTVDDLPKTKFDLDLKTETFGADSVTEETENLLLFQKKAIRPKTEKITLNEITNQLKDLRLKTLTALIHK